MRRLSLLLPALLLATLLWTLAGAAQQPPSLALGSPTLSETRTSEQLAPGVLHTQIVRGQTSATDVYTVDVAFLETRPAARALSARLRADGYLPRTRVITERAQDDPDRRPLGFLVRVGSFAEQAAADELRLALTAGGYAGLRTIYTGEDGGRTSGPWVVNVLHVDPVAFGGTVVPELGTEIVPGLERLSEIAERTGALAAMNGGYFVIGAADGTPGDLAGVSVLDGALVSEAVNGRTSLVLPSATGEGARVAALSTEQAATASDGATHEVDGLNRVPGLVRGCGGSGGDFPTEAPKHDFTCTDAGELIQYTPDFFGARSPSGEGVEVSLDASGTVLELREPRGGPIPLGGSVLAGTDDGAAWLRAHVTSGSRVEVGFRLVADDGAPLALAGELGVVNGGPRLLRGGAIDIPATAEGFHWEERPEFLYRFGVRRNPRTLAGVTAEGQLLLVTVDGRRPGFSVGASFVESARIMQALGAVAAVNLDGGGSTTMTIGSELVTRPSDATGERPIGDAIVLLD